MPRGRKKQSVDSGFEPGTYIEDEFAMEIARKLVELYPEDFGHINLNYVGFVRKVCKKKKKGKIVYANCRPIRRPTLMFASKGWVIVTLGENFSEKPLNIKQRIIFHELLHVAQVSEEVVEHDVQDFARCIELWGVNWIRDGEAPLLFAMEDEPGAGEGASEDFSDSD